MRRLQLQCAAGTQSSRSVLLRRPRLRVAVYDHGAGLQDRQPGEDADGRSGGRPWADGRLGTFRGILRGQVGFGATVFGDKGIAPSGPFGGYESLLAEIVKFFKTGKPPIAPEQTLEIYAFMEAADQSKREGGVPVSLETVLELAKKAAQ